MTRFLLAILFFSAAIVLSSCKNDNKELYKRVMDTHDEVMPRMGEMARLKRQLREKIVNSPDMVIEKKQQIEQAIIDLDQASNGMMDWMHKFNPLPDSANQTDAKAYLNSEMERIEAVKRKMLSAIKTASELLSD